MSEPMENATRLSSDEVRRYIFESRPVRGQWVHLSEAWRDLRAHASYTAAVEQLLGEAVAASVLLAATLKFRGTLTLQLQGDGALRLLVAQCTHDFRVRGVARCDDEALAQLGAAPQFRELVGTAARVTVTIEADEKGSRYQGIVPLSGTTLAESLEAYFRDSEQLPTRVVLAAAAHGIAGLLLQKLPGAAGQDDEALAAAWDQAQAGIAALRPQELVNTPAEQLLARTFATEDLRLFRGTPVRFECRCNPQRVAGVLRSLGAEEIRDLLREQGSVTVTCEFCQRPYRYDSIDIEALFSEGPEPNGAPALH